MKENIEKYIELDKKGYIPAPDETVEQFEKRVSAIKKLKEDVESQIAEKGFYQIEDLKYDKEELIPIDVLLECQNQSKDKYSFIMDYPPSFFSSSGMLFYHGGGAITFEDEDGIYLKDGLFTIFQLRKHFLKNIKYWIYSRNEIISHEVCHVARGPFKAVNYEEYFAYMTSSSGFRKWFGPALWRGIDMTILMLMLLIIFCAQGYVFYTQSNNLIYFGSWAPFSLYLAYLAMRSYSSRSKINRLREKIKSTYSNCLETVDSILFRMTDQEIIEGSASSNLEKFIEEKNDLRWQIIKARFINFS